MENKISMQTLNICGIEYASFHRSQNDKFDVITLGKSFGEFCICRLRRGKTEVEEITETLTVK